jgi:hypothetical protein
VDQCPRQLPHGLDWVKIEDVALELTAGGEIGDDAAVPELPRMDDSYHSNQHVMVKLTVLAPPPDGRRRKLDGEAERRRSQSVCAAKLRDGIDLGEHATRLRSSPGLRRA